MTSLIRLPLVSCLFLFPFFVHAQIETRVAVMTGDSVPSGAPAGVWAEFHNAFLDSAGTLAVQGFARGAATYSLNAQLTPSGAPRSTIFQGQTVLGLGAGVKIKSFLLPGLNEGRLDGYSNGRLLAPALLQGPMIDPARASALVLADADGARVVARQTQPIGAEYNDLISSFGTGRLDAEGRVTFRAPGTSTDPARSYLVQYDEGILSVLARSAGPAPLGIEGAIVSSIPTPLVSDNGSATIACAIRLPNETTRNALISVDASQGKLIVRSGDPAPGLPEGWTFRDDQLLSVLSRNAAGQVLFLATASAPESNPRRGLWLGNGNGSAELIAVQGMPIPGTVSTLDNGFLTGVVNAGGDVAFYCQGLWVKRVGQPLARVAHSDMNQPERAEKFQFLLTNQLQMDSQGNVVFANAGSVWVYNLANELKLVAEHGQKVSYKGRSYTISSPELISSASGGDDGRRRCFSDDGNIAMIVGANNSAGFRRAVLIATLPQRGALNVVPVANNDTRIFTTGPGVPVKIDATANDSDANDDALRIASVTQPAYGRAVVSGNAIVYTPLPTFVGADTFSYTIDDGFGGASSAQVTVRNITLGYRGTYSSTLSSGGRDYGTITVNVTSSGRFTARFQLFSKTYQLSGTLNSNGAFAQHIWEGNDSFFSTFVELHFTPGEGGMRLSGDVARIPAVGLVTVGSVIPYSIAPVARHVGTLPPGIAPSRLLARFTPDPLAPVSSGVGFAAGSISSSGVVLLSGRLPQGPPFATSARLMQDRRITLRMQAKVPGLNLLSGTLTHTQTETTSEHLGTLNWTTSSSPSPIGSEVNVAVDGRMCGYLPPARDFSIFTSTDQSRAALITFALSYGLTLTQPALLDPQDRITFAPQEVPNAAATISRGNGLMLGSLTLGGDTRIPFQAAFYPPAQDFAGVFLDHGSPGRAHFGIVAQE